MLSLALSEHIGSGRMTWSWGATSPESRLLSRQWRLPTTSTVVEGIEHMPTPPSSHRQDSLGSQPSSMALEAPAMRMEPPLKWGDTTDLVITVRIQRERVSGPTAWCKLSLPLVREHHTRSPCLNAGLEVRERYASIALDCTDLLLNISTDGQMN